MLSAPSLDPHSRPKGVLAERATRCHRDQNAVFGRSHISFQVRATTVCASRLAAALRRSSGPSPSPHSRGEARATRRACSLRQARRACRNPAAFRDCRTRCDRLVCANVVPGVRCACHTSRASSPPQACCYSLQRLIAYLLRHRCAIDSLNGLRTQKSPSRRNSTRQSKKLLLGWLHVVSLFTVV